MDYLKLSHKLGLNIDIFIPLHTKYGDGGSVFRFL